MAPPSSDFGTSRDANHIVVLVHDSCVTGEVCIIWTVKGVVAGRGTNALELALVLTVDRELLHDGMRGCTGREGGDGEKGLHDALYGNSTQRIGVECREPYQTAGMADHGFINITS